MIEPERPDSVYIIEERNISDSKWMPYQFMLDRRSSEREAKRLGSRRRNWRYRVRRYVPVELPVANAGDEPGGDLDPSSEPGQYSRED